MDYKKLYEQALERARVLRQEAIDNGYVLDYIKDYETIFPELQESEDERIRKELCAYLEEADDIDKATINRWLAWLEKQKESLHIQESYKENGNSLSDSPLPEDTVLFNKGVAEGRRLERDDMPKWRKMPPGYEIRPANVCSIAIDLLDVNGKCCGLMAREVLQNGNEYLFLDDLEKLPKEE